MAIIYRMTTIDGRKDLDFGGPQIVVLGSGESVPAASGFNEGDLLHPHPDDIEMPILSCVDIGGTKYWRGTPAAAYVDVVINGAVAATTAVRFASPIWTGASKIHVISGGITARTDSGAHDGTDHYGFSVMLFETAGSEVFDTNGLTTVEKVFSFAIDELYSVPANGAGVTLYTDMGELVLTKQNAPTNLRMAYSALIIAPIWE